MLPEAAMTEEMIREIERLRAENQRLRRERDHLTEENARLIVLRGAGAGDRVQSLFLDHLRDVVIVVGSDHAIQFLNVSSESLLPAPRGEWIGRPVDDLIAACGPDGVLGAILEQACYHEAPWGSVFDGVCRPDVSVYEFKSLWVHDAAGAPLGRVVAARDVTGYRDALTALRSGEARYRTLVENIDLGIAWIDRSHNILMANEAHGRLMDKAPEAMAGLKCYQEFRKCDGICEDCPGVLAMESGERCDVQTTLLRDNGEPRIVQIMVFPAYGPGGVVEGFIEFFDDVTERMRIEDEARRHRNRLAHIDRLHTLREMTSELAHEINQPLCAMLSTAQACLRMMRSGHGDPPVMIDAMQDIETQANHAAAIVKRVRHFAKRQEQRLAPVSLRRIVESALELLALESRSDGVTVRVEWPDETPETPDNTWIVADSLLIEQVVLNLCRNALEAMADGAAEAKQLTIRVEQSIDGRAELTVKDTGPGIHPADAERIFDSFYTTKSDGLGIGLPICRSIVEAHGGNLWIDPSPARGAVIRFSLPLHLEPISQ